MTQLGATSRSWSRPIVGGPSFFSTLRYQIPKTLLGFNNSVDEERGLMALLLQEESEESDKFVNAQPSLAENIFQRAFLQILVVHRNRDSPAGFGLVNEADMSAGLVVNKKTGTF